VVRLRVVVIVVAAAYNVAVVLASPAPHRSHFVAIFVVVDGMPVRLLVLLLLLLLVTACICLSTAAHGVLQCLMQPQTGKMICR
jgi:hypothetical protein